MKELSIEEKARRYESALEKCRKLYKEAKANEYTSDIEDYETIFPELKESEDERIRGAIMHFISHTPTVPKGIINKEQMLAWLEKQKQKVNKSPLWKKVDQPIYINTKDIALVQKKDQSDLFKGCLLYLDHTLDPKVDERYILLNDLL